MNQLIECVMNISEGKNKTKIQTIIEPLISDPSVMLMNVESDASYHRTVISWITDKSRMKQSILSVCERAFKLIDMNQQRGVHPRIGAVDVIPLVPIANVSLETCNSLAHEVAQEIATTHNIPVFLYAHSASHPKQTRLANIRRWEYEGLNDALHHQWLLPDYGPNQAHPTAGGVAVGARYPLIAYNIDLQTSNLALAKGIAKQIRESDGGLKGIQAKGVYIQALGHTQVSLNITDFHQTSIIRVFNRVVQLAKEANTNVTGSEIIGLIPKEALANTSEKQLMLTHSLEFKILDDYIERIQQTTKEDVHES